MTAMSDTDRRIRAWMRDEPTTAASTDTLVAGILGHVRATSPRPLLVVVARRPSSVMGSERPRRRGRLTWAVVAAVAAGLAIIGALAAGGIHVDPLPTNAPVKRPFATIAPESRPPATRPPATALPSPAAFRPHMLALPLLGVRLWMHDEGTRDPVTLADKAIADLYVPMGIVGTQRVSLVAGDGERKASIPLGPDTARIACGTVDEMADAISTAFAMDAATRSAVTVDGLAGIRLQDRHGDRVRNVVALRTPTGCLFVSSDGIPTTIPFSGAYDGGDKIVTQVLEDLRIDRPPPTPAPTPPAVTTTDLGFTVTGPRIGWPGTLYGEVNGPGWTFGFGQCAADLCGRWVIVYAARPGERLWKLDHVDGLSLEALRGTVKTVLAYAPVPTLIRLDGVQAWRWDGWVKMVIAMHDGRAYLIQARPGFLGDASLSDLDFVLDGWQWDR